MNTELEEGRLGLFREGAKQPVRPSHSSIDGAKPDKHHDRTHATAVAATGFSALPVVVVTKLEKGRLGVSRKGAKQPVTHCQSSIGGAKPDQQHDPTYGLKVERMIR